LVSASDDGTVKIWDMIDRKIGAALVAYDARALAPIRGRLPDAVSSLALSSDGKTLAWDGDDQVVILWDVAARKEKARFKGHTEFIRSIMYSPDDKILASASDDCIKLWDVATGKERARLAGHTSVIFAVAFGRDGKTLVSGGNDGLVKVWDLTTGKDTTLLDDKNNTVYSLKFSPDGTILAAARSDGSVVLWDVVPTKECK
jgi:WD40 repeat protein